MVSIICENTVRCLVGHTSNAISTDDMLARLTQLKQTLDKEGTLMKSREEVTQESWNGKDVCLLATDVEALFPSLDPRETGDVVRRMIEDSSLEFEGVDLEEALLYVKLNLEHASDTEDIMEFLPARSRRGGEDPTILSPQVKGNKKMRDFKEGKSLWTPKTLPSCSRLRKKIMATVTQIGVTVLFKNFIYSFGGRLYLQQKGGPIGARVTMCAATLVME